MSYRETLEDLISRARTPERLAELEAELRPPPFPAAIQPLWEAFWALRRRAANGGFGPSPIGWSEIDAYVRLTGRPMAPWEVAIIEELDDLYLEEANRKVD